MVPLKKDIKLVSSLQQKKFRQEYGLFVVEGKKMVEESIQSGLKIHSIYTTDGSISIPQACVVTTKEMDRMSSLHSPSPYLAVLHQHHHRLETMLPLSSGILMLDGIKDPGNMGTILRTAEWFGIHHVFCTTDCVELYNPKTIQSTMGSIFRVRVCYDNTPNIVAHLHKHGYTVLAADMSGTSLFEYNFPAKVAIAIGSESHGIRPELRAAISDYITIPGAGAAESLNASIAASIILSENYRQKLQ